MKKKYLILFLGLAAMLTFTACDPKPDLDLDKELKFSPLTVEQQKQKIEDNALVFVDQTEGLLETPAFVAIENFAVVFEGDPNGPMYAPLRGIATDIRNGNSNVLVGLERQMKVIQKDYEEDEGVVFGEYVYNFDTKEFDLKQELENKAIFRLPASPEAMENKDNNGLISFEFTESKILVPGSDDDDDDEGVYYPASAKLSIKVDGKTVLKASFTGKYFDDGMPKEVKQKLEIDDFSWEAKASNDKKEMSAEYAFKKGTKSLIKLAAETSGKFSFEDIDDSDDPDDVVDKIAINCQVMNIAIKAGIADVKGFAEAMDDIDWESLSEEVVAGQEVAIMNQYIVGYGYFTDDDVKFAGVDFYVEEIEYEYPVWDYQGDIYYETYIYYEAMPRFVLSDGSKMRLEEYVNSGFEELFEKIEEIVENYFD
jgi:hypothetical protein